MENKEEIVKPTILELDEFKTNIANEINEAIRKGIPHYLIKESLDNIMHQVNELANKELAVLRANYEEKLSEAKEDNKNKEE